MKPVIKTNTVLLLTALSLTFSIAGCSSTPETSDDPYNQADSQRSRASQTQDELSRETAK